MSKSDAAKWMGSAGYSMARSSQWGDLWPSFYNLNPKRQVIKQADAEVGLSEQQQQEEEEEEGTGRGARGRRSRIKQG